MARRAGEEPVAGTTGGGGENAAGCLLAGRVAG
jgi:hypothetical protein